MPTIEPIVAHQLSGADRRIKLQASRHAIVASDCDVDSDLIARYEEHFSSSSHSGRYLIDAKFMPRSANADFSDLIFSPTASRVNNEVMRAAARAYMAPDYQAGGDIFAKPFVVPLKAEAHSNESDTYIRTNLADGNPSQSARITLERNVLEASVLARHPDGTVTVPQATVDTIEQAFPGFRSRLRSVPREDGSLTFRLDDISEVFDGQLSNCIKVECAEATPIHALLSALAKGITTLARAVHSEKTRESLFIILASIEAQHRCISNGALALQQMPRAAVHLITRHGNSNVDRNSMQVNFETSEITPATGLEPIQMYYSTDEPANLKIYHSTYQPQIEPTLDEILIGKHLPAI